MNAAKTLFTWINLLATIHQRPKMQIMKSRYLIEAVPLATFDDLKEAMSLIEHNNGVRPYIMKWFCDVFMPAYESKKAPDSKPLRNGETLIETRIAVTSQDLIDKTFEIQKKKLSSKQITETYINQLVNSNIMSSEQSVLDKRANIHYPVKSISENKNLFDFTGSNNISQCFNIRVEDLMLFPDELYIISEITRVIKYSSTSDTIKLIDSNGTETTAEEIVHKHYSNVNECFSTETRSVFCHNALRYDSLITRHISEEYYHNGQNDIKFQLSSSANTENTDNKSRELKYLFDNTQSNNFLSSDNNSYANRQSMNVDDVNHNLGFSQMRKAGGLVMGMKKNPNAQSQRSIEQIDKFFFDGTNSRYRSPAEHTLEESPCKSIIRIDSHSFYYCTLHPDILSIHLESIEHHCKFKDGEMHHSEILKSFGVYKSI
jgi:hypothetical protein